MAFNQDIDRDELRAYLLGELPADERRERIEERLLSDQDLLDALLAEEAELIDDYVFGELTDAELSSFRSNFVITPERRSHIAIARHLYDHAKRMSPENSVEGRQGFFAAFSAWLTTKPVTAGMVFAAMLIAVFLIAWFAVRPESDQGSMMASLNKAYEQERPLESRISGLSYAPKIDRRGASGTAVDLNARNRAELLAQTAYDEKTDAASLHALGRVYLAKKEFDRAATLLEQAIRLEPANIAALSDLGTAYLEMAGKLGDADRGRQIELQARALEQFDRALRERPDLPEPLFNRAIALGKLGQPGQEAAAWRRYLEIDKTSGWADEARQRLAALEGTSSMAATAESLTAQFLTAYRANDADRAFEIVSKNREMITGKLIPQQLAFLFADSGNAEYIDAMRFIGEIEFGRTEDPMWRDAAEYYRNRGAADRETLKQAQDKVRAGYRSCELERCSGANDLFTDARRLFISIGNAPEAAIADYWIGYTLYREREKYDASEQVLLQAEQETKRRGYHWLASHHIAWLAQIYFSREGNSRGIGLSREALDLADRTHDDYNRQKLYESLATAYQMTGAMDEAMDHLGNALDLANGENSSRRQRWRTMNQASEIFSVLGLFAAAEAIESESLMLNRAEIGESSFEFLSLLRLGQFAAKRDDRTTAATRFAESRAVVDTFSQAGRTRQTAYIDLIEAHAYRGFGDCTAALPLYDRAIAYYDIGEFSTDRYDAYKGRMMCHVTLKDVAAIDQQTPAIIAMLEKYRGRIREESNRNAFFGREQDVYDTLVSHELSRGDIEVAFNYTERSRSRTLLDMMAGVSAVAGEEEELKLPAEFRSELKYSQIRDGMPPDVQLLQYAVLPDRVAMWTTLGGELRSAGSAIAASDLKEKVSNYVALLSVAGDVARERRITLAKELGELLIGPVLPLLDPARTLVVIPDKSLAGLPFASLISPATGDFLVREFEIQYAPSSTIFVAGTDKPEADRASERVLAVGDPAFDRAEFASLSELPSAEREAAAIAANYASAQRLSGPEATRAAVVDAIARTDVFHFAGHYVYDRGSPMRSGLLLAGTGDSMLPNHEIAQMRLGHLNLVVLSACETGSEEIVDGEGMLGAARTFLAAGVPLVVATHWEVDSEATAEVMTQFHKFRKSDGLSSVSALRRAQLSMLESPNPRYREPFYWAPFIAYGAFSFDR
jgi:CHAT domain-containing protein/tetratricopeptide (TPR) repeat protein